MEEKMKMRTVSIQLTVKEAQKLAEIAVKNSRSLSGQIRHLIKTHPEGVK